MKESSSLAMTSKLFSEADKAKISYLEQEMLPKPIDEDKKGFYMFSHKELRSTSTLKNRTQFLSNSGVPQRLLKPNVACKKNEFFAKLMRTSSAQAMTKSGPINSQLDLERSTITNNQPKPTIL
jgi:hypothetical protein